MLPAEVRHLVQSRKNQCRCFVAGQRRKCDAEETKPRGEDGVLLELVVSDSIVASDDDPAVRACLAQPDNVFGPLRKEFVMDTDLDTRSAKRLGHFLFGPAIDR